MRSRPDWSEFENDIEGFCGQIGDGHWHPQERARVFLSGVQRGYRRVGLAGADDSWKACAVACLWLACCYPERLQLVMCGTTKSGQNWVRYLEGIVKTSTPALQESLTFTEDLILTNGHEEPALIVLTPGMVHSVAVDAPRLQNGRSTVLMMPDFDRVPSAWLPNLTPFVAAPDDQWLVVTPVRR